jgi:hypothetical protein
MRPPARRTQAFRLRSGDTKIGRLLLPGLVLVFAAYVTYQLCQGVAASAFAARGGFQRADAATLAALAAAGAATQQTAQAVPVVAAVAAAKTAPAAASNS